MSRSEKWDAALAAVIAIFLVLLLGAPVYVIIFQP